MASPPILDNDIDTRFFDALLNINLDELVDKDLTRILPYLTRFLLSPTFSKRRQVLELLYPIKRTNDVIKLLATKPIEIHETNTVLPVACFEPGTPNERLRIVAAEYLKIQERARQSNLGGSNTQTKRINSELFDNPLYIDDISYCLYALLIKATIIPAMNIIDMTEALLHVKHGSTYIVNLVINMPSRCLEICTCLINYGERQDECASYNEISEQRARTLRTLCLLNSSVASTVRSLTLQTCKMPSLTVMITIDNLEEARSSYERDLEDQMTTDDNVSENGTPVSSQVQIDTLRKLEDSYDNAVAFITGIFLGVDENIRTWFAQYTKTAQLKRIDQSQYTILSKLRSLILSYTKILFSDFLEEEFHPENNSISVHRDMTPSALNRKLIRATATLKLFCALRGIGCLKLNPDESETLLRLITCRKPASLTSVNFATTGVCTLLVCSTTVNNQRDEKRAADWIKWLVKDSNYSDSKYSNAGIGSISELLLLIAIHFQNHQTNQIAELICATIGMKLSTKASVSKCKSLFVQEVFTERMIVNHAVNVPVTPNLNDNIKDYLPIHCINHLVESRSFTKQKVFIKDWIFKQICASSKPVHHMLPKLIEAYVIAYHEVPVAQACEEELISENDIAQIFQTRLYSLERSNIYKDSPGSLSEDRKKKFKHDKMTKVNHSQSYSQNFPVIDIEVTQVLCLYYLLLYEETRANLSLDFMNDRAFKYSSDLMMEVPIYYLLQLVRENQDSFESVLPHLLKLFVSQYPQLCIIEHWLTMDHYDTFKIKNDNLSGEDGSCNSKSTALGISIRSRSSREASDSREGLQQQLESGFAKMNESPTYLLRAINSILTLSRAEIWTFVDSFIDNWSQILTISASSDPDYLKLVQVTTKLWWKLNTIFPRKLWVMTINSLRREWTKAKFDAGLRSMEYTWSELAFDPLIVLRCDARVFRCPEVLDILLHVLSAFLAASKRFVQSKTTVNEQKESRKYDELGSTLILAQTSAAIQILLESCCPTDEEKEITNKQEQNANMSPKERFLLERYESSVNCVCQHLHQVFIADTNLAKLVHFQTYPSELLPTVSDKIPSMHICLDFIPELVSQPDLKKQVFFIELTSHLCEKYAITKSLNVAKLCFNVAFTLLQLLPSDKRASVYIPVLPALLRVCKVFPILQEDARIILNQIREITFAHMASTSSRLSLGSTRPFEDLDKMTFKDVKRLMRRLGSDEALYLCIQKCSVDLNSIG